MSVTENDLLVGPLTPDAGVTLISLDFPVEDAEWIEVYQGESEAPLVLGTDYTVGGVGEAAGFITLIQAANGTDAYSVFYVVPLERSSDLQRRGQFRSLPFNVELDRIWRAMQGINTRLSRSLRASRTSEPLPPAVLESGSDFVGRPLVFNEDGTAIIPGPPVTEIETANQILTDAQAARDAAQEAQAGAEAAENTMFEWKGQWVTGTDYELTDAVGRDGRTWACEVPHTAGDFDEDQTAGYWGLVADRGLNGEGTGDLLAEQNLQDLQDPGAAWNFLKQGATPTAAGVIRRATAAELAAGLADVVPDAQLIQQHVAAQVAPISTRVDGLPFWSWQESQAYTGAGQVLTFQHDLGGRPDFVSVDLVCTVANNGFLVGEIIHDIQSTVAGDADRNHTAGFAIISEGDNALTLAVGPKGLYARNKTGAGFFVSAGQWDIQMSVKETRPVAVFDAPQVTPLVVTQGPSISGDLFFGGTLSLDDGAATGTGTPAVIARRWFADGVQVPNETEATYTPPTQNDPVEIYATVLWQDDVTAELAISPTVTVTGASTQPPQVEESQWELRNNPNAQAGGELIIEILEDLADGGSPLTDITYTLNGGEPFSTGLLGPGTFTIPNLNNGEEYDVRLIAENAIDVAPPSVAKQETPQDLVGPVIASLTYDGTGTFTLQVNEGDTVFWRVDNDTNLLPSDVEAGGGLAAGSHVWTGASGTVVMDFSAVPNGVHTLHMTTRDPDGNLAGSVVSDQFTFEDGVSDTVPVTPDADDFDVATGSAESEIDLTINSLPANGGQPITGGQYRINGAGSWIAIPGYAGTGTYTLTMAAASTSYGFEVRFINSVGESLPSPSESATSGAAAGGGGSVLPTIIGAPQQDSSSTNITFTPSTFAGLATGDKLLAAIEYRGSDQNEVTLPAGFTLVASSLAASGVASSDIAVAIYQKDVTEADPANDEPDAVFVDPGGINHLGGSMIAVRDVNNIAVRATAASAGAETAVSSGAMGNTGGDDALLLIALANAIGAQEGINQVTSPAAANLANLTLEDFRQHVSGGDAGINVYTGELATAGDAGTFTATLSNADEWALSALELRS